MYHKNRWLLKRTLEEKAKKYYEELGENAGYRLDRAFVGPNDEPLTEEEIKEIDKYWGRFKFAYPNIDYKSFEIFKNRLGRFDVRHCPGNLEFGVFYKTWEKNSYYAVAFQNKARLPAVFPDINQPRTIVRRMRTVLYDENFNPITKEEAVRLILDYCAAGPENRVIVKPNGRNGGHGIEIITPEMATEEYVLDVFQNKMAGHAFVAQEMMTQSAFTARFNQSSVNTIRVFSLFFDSEIHILGALLRVGNAGSVVDNFCSGGSFLGIDLETGKCNDWALAVGNQRISKLPSGIDLAAEDLYVPNFDKVKENVTSMHYRMPYVRMIAWDIALNQDNVPTLIECNFCGYYQMSEAVNGPLFGDLLDRMLKQWCLQFFNIEFVYKNFRCREFHNYISIAEYLGKDGRKVVIPPVIRGKKVTRVAKDAFKGYEKLTVLAPEAVRKNSPAAIARFVKK